MLPAACWRVKPWALFRKSPEYRTLDSTGTAMWIVTKVFPTRQPDPPSCHLICKLSTRKHMTGALLKWSS